LNVGHDRSAGTLVMTYDTSDDEIGTIATLTISKMSHSWNHSELQTENGTVRVDHLGEFNQVCVGV
jgi:hypothetical protein